MAAPEDYVAWVNAHVGFNPRGQSHSDYLTASILRDLAEHCVPFRDALMSGAIELRKNVGLTGKRHTSPVLAEDDEGGEIEPNIDGVVLKGDGLLSVRSTAIPVPVTIENKTIMTAHGKARTNRYNDARAYATHVHSGSPDTIAAFTIVINTALVYKNPDQFAASAKRSGINHPEDARKTIDLFRGMRLRSDPADPVGRCEAVYILAIDYDGVTPRAHLVVDPPAPRSGEPFSYEWFIERLCGLYARRNT